MSSIGSIDCFRINGTLPKPKTKLAVWTVPGVNGYGAQDLGLQDQAFEISAVFYDTIANCTAFKNNLCDLQGTTVSITDDLGETTSKCLIVEVGQARMEPARTPDGSIQERCEVPIRGVVRA